MAELTRACKGCGAVPFKPHFRSLPPVGKTASGDIWCDDCVIAGKSDLDKHLVDYVKKLHENV